LHSKLRILVVDDTPSICRMLSVLLTADGHEVETAETLSAALSAAARRSFDMVFLDLKLGDDNGMDAIAPLLASSPWLRIVVITAYGAVDSAVEAMKRGASDYLSKSLTPAMVRLVIKRMAELQAQTRRNAALQEALATAGPAADFDTTSTEMRDAVELARRTAAGGAAILIHGEQGTGKRTLARAIHAWSPRADHPLAVAGCRAPSPAHLEAEWFGTSRKMPGGEVLEQPGRVGFCEGGTLLVQDVEQLPQASQPKLLRLIQDQQYERHGHFSPRRANVRVVATTTADLGARVAKGQFYQDLLYALRGVSIEVPPLRRRQEDIPLLAERYLAFYSRQAHRAVVGFAPAATDALRRHSWPGNLRELRNLVERAVLVCRGELVEPSDFPPGILNRVNEVTLGDPVTLEKVEELHIRGVLAASASIDAAAETLGMDNVTLWRRRKKYGI
jgi:NtrC-family two-component system response regulator AlgB